jgi:hypothetical protein
MDELPPLRHHTDPFQHVNHKAQRDASLLAYLHTLPPEDVAFIAKYRKFIRQEIV